jgi:diguanylate cyclase
MNSSTPMFLIGLIIGTSLLLIGLGLGLWLGRKMVPPPVLDDSPEREQLIRFVKNFATWTTDFQGDFSKYQTQVRTLSQQAESSPATASMKDVQHLLKQISVANQDLQSRLESAEERLENQTKELASYLTEARTDGLTGLSNRRAFDQKVDEYFAKWMASKKAFCLALIDIDFFKKINDTHGHPAGDAVLQDVAAQLRHFAADQFEVARYGGEEFAILLNEPLELAAKSIDKLRESIQSKVVQADGKSIRVSISCGVSLVLPEERVGKLVRRADEALYSAKQGGRNRVYVHDGKLCRPFGNPGPVSVAPASTTVASGHDGSIEGNALGSRQQRLQQRLEKLIEKS